MTKEMQTTTTTSAKEPGSDPTEQSNADGKIEQQDSQTTVEIETGGLDQQGGSSVSGTNDRGIVRGGEELDEQPTKLARADGASTQEEPHRSSSGARAAFVLKSVQKVSDKRTVVSSHNK